MARSERQGDGTRGGVGTMTRPGARPRPQQAPDPGQGAADPRRGRQARPVPPQEPEADKRAAKAQRSGTGGRGRGQRADAVKADAAPARQGARTRTGAPRGTGPQPARTTGPQPAVPPGQAQAPAGQAARPAPLGQQAEAAAAGRHRMPFVLLLCGLLGGALVSALVISTTLAEGSFQITKLQESTSALAKQSQTLEEQVAQDQSAQVIEERAARLGMRRPGELLFLDLKTGKTTNDGPTWSGAVNAPGYAP
jgi:hypothetical protein